jgi:hypothetical protein
MIIRIEAERDLAVSAEYTGSEMRGQNGVKPWGRFRGEAQARRS